MLISEKYVSFSGSTLRSTSFLQFANAVGSSSSTVLGKAYDVRLVLLNAFLPMLTILSAMTLDKLKQLMNNSSFIASTLLMLIFCNELEIELTVAFYIEVNASKLAQITLLQLKNA